MKNILYIIPICIFLLSACEYDNYDEPNATLKGSVVYNGKSVGIRTDGPQLELWQDGFALKKSIPVYIAQDGTFSVSLFNGQYKLVRKADGPWLPQLNDTIIVDVKGNTVFDVPVTPYFVAKDESYQKVGETISVKFTVDKVVSTADLSSVNIYFGKGILTDHNRNEGIVNVPIGNVTVGQEITVSAAIPAGLKNENFVFMRIGVLANVSSEYYYTQSQKINLK
ncbi:DUF3823 domain-containing protein [Prevotella sp. 10(H)]|uniref:DUF3823 domain-containing protein n=1 Tax=Prevotella sp. 10(H) TaxID=1158294 RepID=UPI0004A71668|nr:DUF3823 domain-containing protein [Prevotella sp. 10(H)]